MSIVQRVEGCQVLVRRRRRLWRDKRGEGGARQKVESGWLRVE